MPAVNQRISRYMMERMGMATEVVNALRVEYFQKYGTTMRGLSIHYGIACDDYLEYVHDLPITDYLAPNAALDQALASIPCPKVIFSNASVGHCQRVLAALGIARHFGQIFDVATVDYEGKPAVSAYHKVLRVLSARPTECLIVEDMVRNLLPAKEMGMVTVLVDGSKPGPLEGVDYVVAEARQVTDVVEGLKMAAEGAYS